MTRKQAYIPRLTTWLGSRTAFRIILGLLVIQASWIALSGRYPMAFDEDFHLGIIKLYAHHISPFWSTQPPGDGKFGAIGRDPSYLYQYLMSFPYRLISLFTHDQTIQVLFLRALNIGLFAWGVTLFRRLLLKAGGPKAIVHACLLMLVLIPVVPLLAAQINYDNLGLPLTALTLILTLKFNQQLTDKKRLDLASLWQLAIVGLLTSLVKYAFLPIFLAIVVFIAVRLWQKRRTVRPIVPKLRSSWANISRPMRWGLIIGLIVSAGLFGQRYGVNLVRYHTPVPSCNQVLSFDECSDYGPWIRDYTAALANTQAPKTHEQLTFTHAWLYGLWLRTFFTVDGPGTQFQTRGPLLLPGLGAIVMAVIAGLALLASLPAVWRYRTRSELWLFGLASTLYLAALWQDEYKAYVHTGQPVAINGRYLLPVLQLIFLLVALAFNRLLGRWHTLKLALMTAVLVCLIWGGGALTYILRSNDAWFWPNSTVIDVNRSIRQTLGPIIPGYNNLTQFLH